MFKRLPQRKVCLHVKETGLGTNQDMCCQFVSVVWLGPRPQARGYVNALLGPTEERERNMPTRLFVLPSFHGAAARSDLSQLGG